VESLTSYFCRLAHSHGMSAVQLARWVLERHGYAVPDDYKWCQRNFVSMDGETERWAAWLSELTGVGGLDYLSLAPWRHLLGVHGLVPPSDRWCPCCLAADRSAGQNPFLRLSWDIAPVCVCLDHKVELACQCPHCHRTNVRNRTAIVVPGYCTACGGFLGDAKTAPATPEALWVSRHVGLMLANPLVPIEREAVAELLREVVSRMAGGNVARFAKRLGMSKSGVWHWVNRGGLPGLGAWLGISRQGGIALDRLLRGNFEAWEPPLNTPQLSLELPRTRRKGIVSRVLDWGEIAAQLQTILKETIPTPLAEVSERLGIDVKLLYLRANREARAISARYRAHRLQEKQRQVLALKERLEQVLTQRRGDGYDGMSARDLREQLAGTDMANVRNMFAVIKEVREAGR